MISFDFLSWWIILKTCFWSSWVNLVKFISNSARILSITTLNRDSHTPRLEFISSYRLWIPKKFICYVNNNLWSHWISISIQIIYGLKRRCFAGKERLFFGWWCEIYWQCFVFLWLSKETFRLSLFNKVLHQ